ncbi:hypothetical protein TRVL_09354 [Trypanosoma vivax]|nr:hypothetical protein TRVL_09354 [Trypanosoma vivax]
MAHAVTARPLRPIANRNDVVTPSVSALGLVFGVRMGQWLVCTEKRSNSILIESYSNTTSALCGSRCKSVTPAKQSCLALEQPDMHNELQPMQPPCVDFIATRRVVTTANGVTHVPRVQATVPHRKRFVSASAPASYLRCGVFPSLCQNLRKTKAPNQPTLERPPCASFACVASLCQTSSRGTAD